MKVRRLEASLVGWFLLAAMAFGPPGCAEGGGGGARDRSPPAIEVAGFETTFRGFAASSPALLEGTASDNRKVRTVAWTNRTTRGTGKAEGTDTWEASIPLTVGANWILITAEDRAGNTTEKGICVTLDIVPPTVEIRVPAGGLTGGAKTSPFRLEGTLDDDHAPRNATWTNLATGETDDVEGSDVWFADIPLAPGKNEIRVTGFDLAGNRTDVPVALTLASGGVRAWGLNQDGQLGNGLRYDSPFPVDVRDPMDTTRRFWEVVQVAGGHQRTLALRGDGTVWVWGATLRTGPGGPVEVIYDLPEQVRDLSDPTGLLSDVVDISTCGGHDLAVKSDGSVRAWGRNAYGQLGNDTVLDSALPVPVLNSTFPPSRLSNAVAVSAGGDFSLALMADGTVRAWGDGADGKLGDGRATGALTPVMVFEGACGPCPLRDVVAVAAGWKHSLALLSDGTIRAWGFNARGTLGDGTTNSRDTAVTVLDAMSQTDPLRDAVQVAAGMDHSIALLADGTLRVWGSNEFRQLGLGLPDDRLLPVHVPAPSNPFEMMRGVQDVAAGAYHTAALFAWGAVWTWGENAFGQLGNGSAAPMAGPMPVVDPVSPTHYIDDVTGVDAGAYHTVTLR